jgi:hypothetical protein
MKRLVLLCSLALLIFLIAPTHSAEARHSADLGAMHKHLQKKAAIFRSINMRASRNLINGAQVKVFDKYFRADDPIEKARLKKKILKISRSIQKGFEVDEICLIRMNGREVMRIVLNEAVLDSKLSSDESKSPFFKASLMKGFKEIHIQRPYISPGSKRWVIAYTTPIVTQDGSKPAFLHYEIPISFFAKKMAKGTKKGAEYVLIVDKEGRLWTDSRSERDLGKNLPRFGNGSSPGIKKVLKAIQNGQLGSESFTEDGVKYTIVYKPLGYFGWSVAVVSH